MEFSEKEQKLYDFIKEKGQVTIKDIENTLGASVTGAIGRLIREELVEKKKIKMGEGYGMRMQKVYIIKEKDE